MITAEQRADELIDAYKDSAYEKAIEFTVVAVHFKDNVGAKMFGDAAIVLLKRGYHKKTDGKQG